MIVLAAMLTSCEKPVEGELTLLVDGLDALTDKYGIFSFSPDWSEDCSKVYYLDVFDSMGNYAPLSIWSIDITSGEKKQLLEGDDEILSFDVSGEGNLLIPYFTTSSQRDQWIFVYDLLTCSVLDSIEPGYSRAYARFSIESSDVLYYEEVTSDEPKTLQLHKCNWKDSTNEVVLEIPYERRYDFAPGPGDTLFAFGNRICNLNSSEILTIDIDSTDVRSLDWNPANPGELVIATGLEGKLYMFDTKTRELEKIDTKETNASSIYRTRFSPDGKKIVFTVAIDADAVHFSQIWLFERDLSNQEF